MFIMRPSVPLLSYITIRYLNDPREVREEAAGQLKSRALWKDTVLRLVSDGVDRFIEMGPGSALTRMVRWVDRGALALPAEELWASWTAKRP